MKLFNTLCLEITARCNRKCEFCPVAYNTRPDERMDKDLVIKVLDELHNLDYRGRIEFYIYNEPLKDKAYCYDIVTLARKLVPRSCLMIATNGDYLRGAADIVELFGLGLNQLLINCYSKGLYERRLPWIKALPERVSRDGSVYNALSPRKQVVQLLDKSNPEEFGTGVFRLVNRAGNIPQFLPALAKPVERMCTKPFRLLNINWLGEALVCCQDYHGVVSYANVRTHTVSQMWEHPVMNEYRKHLLQKDRSLPLCRSCDCHAGSYSHNVPKPDGDFAGVEVVEKLYANKR